MAEITVDFRRIDGTRALLGTAGGKSVVADRPAGVAGGLGLGLSGGELQALAIGAGFANQLQFSAEALDETITELRLEVTLEFVEDLVAGTRLRLTLDTAGGPAATARLLDHAKAASTISASVTRGFPVEISV